MNCANFATKPAEIEIAELFMAQNFKDRGFFEFAQTYKEVGHKEAMLHISKNLRKGWRIMLGVSKLAFLGGFLVPDYIEKSQNLRIILPCELPFL